MESETQRAQFDSAMVMIRHLTKCATDEKLRDHMARQLEREVVGIRFGKAGQSGYDGALLRKKVKLLEQQDNVK